MGRAVVVLALYGLGVALSIADTVVLQQGVGGYQGCRSATLWGPKAKRAGQADEKFICLRGTQNIALIRFDLGLRPGGEKTQDDL